MTSRSEAEAPVVKALRALQVLDEVADLGKHRALLLEAESALGIVLELKCTGLGDEGRSHDGDTCPVHEWLYPWEDYARAQQLRNV